MVQTSRGVYRRRRVGLVAFLALAASAGVYASVGAGDTDSKPRRVRTGVAARRPAHQDTSPAASTPAARQAPRPPVTPLAQATQSAQATPRALVKALQVNVPSQIGTAWTVTALVHGRPAAWLAERSGVSLMRFDQSLVHLTLHAGYDDGGTSGWTYGDRITPSEIHWVIAGFNGGFKLTYHGVGFMSARHVAAPLEAGLGSIVTYTDGTTDIGAWHADVPSARQTVYSVLQNQRLLVDRGVPAANVTECILACWGATVGGQTVVARSGLGVTQSGQLVWAAGEKLTPAGLAHALIAAGAVRAVERHQPRLGCRLSL